MINSNTTNQGTMTYAAVLVVGMFVATPPNAMAQTSSDQTVYAPTPSQRACVVAMNRGALKVATATAATIQGCLKGSQVGGAGDTTSLEECVTDRGEKISKAMFRLVRTDRRRCQGSAPSFGYRGAATASLAAYGEVVGAVEEAVGVPMSHVVLPTLRHPCMRSVVGAQIDLLLRRMKGIDICAKGKIAGGEADGETALVRCVEQSQAPSQVLTAKHGSRIDRKCDFASLGSIFPSECARRGDASSFVGCLTAVAGCRACNAQNVIGGIEASCDIVDDAAANGTCTVVGGSQMDDAVAGFGPAAVE